jgi:hypothetical protein
LGGDSNDLPKGCCLSDPLKPDGREQPALKRAKTVLHRDPTIADAVLDRLLSQAHCINLKGESLRGAQREASAKKGDDDTD